VLNAGSGAEPRKKIFAFKNDFKTKIAYPAGVQHLVQKFSSMAHPYSDLNRYSPDIHQNDTTDAGYSSPRRSARRLTLVAAKRSLCALRASSRGESNAPSRSIADI